MRITGGTLAGRRLAVPPGEIRPAMDRMRESVFARLGDLEGCSFLDLFTGSGAVGLEAWSRGARPVLLIERDRGKRRTILANLAGLAEPPTLRIEPVERFIQRNTRAFDLVFLDPPFAYPHKLDLLERLALSRSLAPGALVAIHAPAAERFPESIAARLDHIDRRPYGNSIVTFFRRGPAT